jgi:origin recognition complex subunit 2
LCRWNKRTRASAALAKTPQACGPLPIKGSIETKRSTRARAPKSSTLDAPAAHPDDQLFPEYFESQLQTTTSDNTLSSLPTITHAEFREVVEQLQPTDPVQVDQLKQFHRSQYRQWQFELREGFNILMHGYGSKKTLLEEFSQRFQSQGYDVCLVYGFHPSMTIKGLLNTLSKALDCPAPVPIQDHLQAVIQVVQSEYSRANPLYIFFHGIDSPGVRQEKSQEIFAALASLESIRFVASVDHINAFLLWDYFQLSKFNWIPHLVTTFQPYLEETAMSNTLMIKSGQVTSHSALAVLASLPHNSKECFRLLAKAILQQRATRGTSAEGAGDPDETISYTSLYALCRENFLVSEDSNFRTILTEFKDHEVIQLKRVDGVEIISTSLGVIDLEKIMESMDT